MAANKGPGEDNEEPPAKPEVKLMHKTPKPALPDTKMTSKIKWIDNYDHAALDVSI